MTEFTATPANAQEMLRDEMAMLDQLLTDEAGGDDFDDDIDGGEELVETSAGSEIPDDVLSAAIKSLENEEFYKDQPGGAIEGQSDADKPTLEAEQPMRKMKDDKKTAKPPKAAKEPKVQADKPPKESKSAVDRVTFAGNSKSAVLEARLGGQSDKYLILEDSDAMLDETTLALKQAALREDFDVKLAKKVAEKGIMLFRDLSRNVTVDNEVMRRAFQVLKHDGFLTSGDKGNLQQNLAAKYSVGTQRAQASQVFSLFQFLKIVEKSGTQFVINPKSTIFAAAKY